MDTTGHWPLDTGQVIFVARIYAIAQSKMFLDEGMEAGKGRTQITETLSKVASSATLLFWYRESLQMWDFQTKEIVFTWI